MCLAFLHRLICDAKVRLGHNGIKDFQNHPFFNGMDWDNIRKTDPPFIPEYSSPTDTRNFDPIEEEDDGMPRGHYVSVMCRSHDLFCWLVHETFCNVIVCSISCEYFSCFLLCAHVLDITLLFLVDCTKGIRM